MSTTLELWGKNSTLGMCDCCQYDNIPVEEFGDIDPDKVTQAYFSRRKMNLCEICGSSFISNSYQYNKEGADLYRSLGWIANHLLKAIKEINVVRES